MSRASLSRVVDVRRDVTAEVRCAGDVELRDRAFFDDRSVAFADVVVGGS